jgi:hypothetical protein
MKEFVVFYAWQSDTAQRFNRHLIRLALNLAAKNISDDLAVNACVRIDVDTERVLGHVPVTETILKKIAACDAFVPDLTFVARTGAGKAITNSNVMLEYGYALRAKSHSIMIPVMNAAYGPAEELPFDMGHQRFPLQYNLPETATKAERVKAAGELTTQFEDILRRMIAAASTLDERETARSSQQQEAARAYLAPELHRTIERALYIHGRALANFICASSENGAKPNDRKEDFFPYRPSLYPAAPQIRDLPAEDAAALSAYYDSLNSLSDHVNDWWGREDQLPVNIFNSFLHDAEKILTLAQVCIERFELDRRYPPKHEAVGTLSARIIRSFASAAGAMKHHIARWEAKAALQKRSPGNLAGVRAPARPFPRRSG